MTSAHRIVVADRAGWDMTPAVSRSSKAGHRSSCRTIEPTPPVRDHTQHLSKAEKSMDKIPFDMIPLRGGTTHAVTPRCSTSRLWARHLLPVLKDLPRDHKS